MMGKATLEPDIRPMVDRECYKAALQIIREGDTPDRRKGHARTYSTGHAVNG
jgi:hypothetical protein